DGLGFLLSAMKPRRRLGVTHISKQQRIILQGEHLLNGRYFWHWNDRFAFTVQPKSPDLGWPTEQVADIKRIGRRNDLLDDRVASRNDLNCVRQCRSAEFVKIDLLIEIQIRFGPLTLLWETSVINSSAVRAPGRAATRCGILHVGNGVRQRFPRRSFVEVKGAVFAAAF